MIDQLPSDADLHARVEQFFKTSFSTDNPIITEAVRRMLAAGGKRLRPRVALLGAAACAPDQPLTFRHLALASYMELIHVATLIHDDVVDQAATRRGVNATAIDFGNRVSVLAGDYLFAWIFKNVTADYEHPIPHILSATLATICDGEVLQLKAVGNLGLPIEGYVEIVDKKTAALFAASAMCGAHAGRGSADYQLALRDYGHYFGVGFQMLDDLLDMTADAKALGKPVGNDLRERKVTLPLIHALENGDAAFRGDVERFFASDDESPEAIAKVVAGIGQSAGFERTKETIAVYAERAVAALGDLVKTPAGVALANLARDLNK